MVLSVLLPSLLCLSFSTQASSMDRLSIWIHWCQRHYCSCCILMPWAGPQAYLGVISFQNCLGFGLCGGWQAGAFRFEYDTEIHQTRMFIQWKSLFKQKPSEHHSVDVRSLKKRKERIGRASLHSWRACLFIFLFSLSTPPFVHTPRFLFSEAQVSKLRVQRTSKSQPTMAEDNFALDYELSSESGIACDERCQPTYWLACVIRTFPSHPSGDLKHPE